MQCRKLVAPPHTLPVFEVNMSKKFCSTLYFKVLLGIALGIAFGFIQPDIAVKLKPLGDAFINLIKMIITPVIFCTVSVGIARMESLKAVGRVGGKTLLYFEIVTTLALFIGLIVVHFVQPGAGIHADPATMDASTLGKFAHAKQQSTQDFIMGIIPHSVVGAFAEGNLLQVLLFSVLFGMSLSHMGDKPKQAILGTLERFSNAFLGVVNLIMKLAPVGAFGAITFTIGKYGVGALASLGKLVACLYITSALFVILVLGLICKLSGVNIWQLIKYMKEEIFITLGTASTEAVLPRSMEKMEALGIKKSVVGLVFPTGYSFNLDGAAIYLTMAASFIAQAMDIHLDIQHQITLMLVLLLTSKGGAGVAGAALIALAATLSATNIIPVVGMTLVIGIDRILNEMRAVVNLIGNCVATVAIGRWEKSIDLEHANLVLSGKINAEDLLENNEDMDMIDNASPAAAPQSVK